MTKREKLLLKLRNSRAGARANDVQTLLLAYGFKLDRTKGSHRVYVYDDGKIKKAVVIPVHGNEVKPLYISDVVQAIDELKQETGNDA